MRRSQPALSPCTCLTCTHKAHPADGPPAALAKPRRSTPASCGTQLQSGDSSRGSRRQQRPRPESQRRHRRAGRRALTSTNCRSARSPTALPPCPSSPQHLLTAAPSPRHAAQRVCSSQTVCRQTGNPNCQPPQHSNWPHPADMTQSRSTARLLAQQLHQGCLHRAIDRARMRRAAPAARQADATAPHALRTSVSPRPAKPQGLHVRPTVHHPGTAVTSHERQRQPDMEE